MRKRHRQRGPLCAALSKLYGGQDPYTIVRAFARDLVFTSKQQGPPFSPFLFARSLGLRVVYDAIDAEGLLMDGEHGVALREPGVPRELFPSGEGGALDDGLRGPVIKLRERWSRSGRRRSHFTLGHEIGHFVIREALSGFVPMSMFALENPEEERLADEFAGELLVPKFWLRKDLKRLGLDPSALVSLADRYEVSLQCLLTSVTKLFGRGKVGTVIWEKVEGLYRAGWACPRSFGEMLLCDTGRTTVVHISHALGQVLDDRQEVTEDLPTVRFGTETRLVPRREEPLKLARFLENDSTLLDFAHRCRPTGLYRRRRIDGE